jgi:hypothetical protein
MAQILFGTDTTPNLGDLDANFTELYGFAKNLVSDGDGNVLVGAPAATLGTGYRNFHVRGSSGGIVEVSTATNSVGLDLSPASGRVGTRTSLPFSIITNNAERLRVSASGEITPGADNSQSMGAGAARWSTVYAATGTINTSDAREKTAVQAMAVAEVSAAKQLSAEIGTYKFLSAIAAKGAAARTHVGMTVQRAIEVMESHGLDPFAYGFICYDSWPAKAAVEGEPAQPAGDRYSFRPDELLLFIARGFEARLAALEAAAA